MPHAIWSGSLAFGMVSIPVQLHSAVHEHAIHFHQISKASRRRIHYRKVVEGSDEPVDDADIVKGYEVRSGSYVVFSDAELRALAARKSAVIDIESFVKLSDIDPRYCDALYYLAPAEAPAKPYQLLLQALAAADRVGIARFIMHGKEHLVMVRSLTSVLGLQTLHFSDEIINPSRLAQGMGRTTLSARELTMASQLISRMSGRFTPAAYKDAYAQRISTAIAKRSRGHAIAVVPDSGSERDEGATLDLMAALERSMPQREAGRGQRPAGRGKRAQVRPALQGPSPAHRAPHARRHPHAS
jgi:DNA end-binding protein Ku